MKFSIGESIPRKKKVFSELIRWFEGTNHSHVFVTWKDNLGLRWVAEAKGSGVRMLSNVHFKKEAVVINVYSYEIDQDGLESAIKYAWEQMAKAYGFKQIYGLAEMRILNKIYRMLGLKKKAKNRFTDGEASQICSEFAVRFAEAAKKEIMVEGSLEQWGLLETQGFCNKTGVKQPREKIDRINGVK